MAKRFPVAPAHPERNCWGCDRYCSARDLQCGNGSVRTQHPCEIFGADWLELEPELGAAPAREPGPARSGGTPGRPAEPWTR